MKARLNMQASAGAVRELAALTALAVGSVVAAAAGLAGLSYLLLSVLVFGLMSLYLIGGDR